MTAHRVLVADDSDVVRALLGAQLRERGYDVLEAHDGEEALVVTRRERPDLVLIDLEMPGVDGYGVLDALKADPELVNIPVVFVTARDEQGGVIAALERGAQDYLRKPFDPPELVARVQAALRAKLLQDELRALNERLERLACTDELTGLYNRRSLDDHVGRLVSRCQRHGRQLAVLLADIDEFKVVNDEHGHRGGDAVLVNIAARLGRRLRREDLLGRWGGEEFMVLAPDTDAAGAQALAEALRLAVSDTPFRVEGRAVPVTASLGWATWRGDDAEELVRRADGALYAAKAAGRNCVSGERPDAVGHG